MQKKAFEEGAEFIKKKYMRKFILLTAVVLVVLPVFAQRKKGSWQDYLSFANATKVVVSPTKIYGVTEGGLFYYDLQDNSVNKLSAINGLSDFGIKTVAYSNENKVLVVAYKNSNIDLVYDNSVVSLSDIKRKQITGDKSINNIHVENNEAYLACGFGIVVLNLNNPEIKDTYYIGENGSPVGVNDVTLFNGSVYAATNNGILKASTASNLLDYRNWSKIVDIAHADGKFNFLEVHGGKLIANYTPEEWFNDAMYVLNGNSWEPYLPEIRFAYDIQSNGNFLTIASRNSVNIINENDIEVGKITSYQFGDTKIGTINPRSSVTSDDGTIWIADWVNSLVKFTGSAFEKIQLNGPMDNSMFSLYQSGPDLWVAHGNKRGWEPLRFQRFSNNQWEYFSKENHPELDGFSNIVSIAVDPFDPEHFFAASWGGGLLEYRNGEFVDRYTHKNSPLQTALPPDNEENYIRIGGMDFDSEGNLWITNSEVSKSLLMLTRDGEWETFELPAVANLYQIGQVLVTQNDDKWIVVPRGHDAYVVGKTGERKQQLPVISYFNNGTREEFTRMNDIFSIAEDNEGAIWLGTSAGVAVYSNPSLIWDTDNFYAYQPGVDLNDGMYHPLLKTETVTAIAVDGGNRKWLGTKSSGIYLVSESGEQELLHFTHENSPLLSNTITSIAVNQLSGEVFIGTDAGLISYMGDAIGGKAAFENVYVYPNPVRETYDGPVTVAGLMENSDVKITDIGGNLVFQTTSLGGQAVWNGKNLNGNRVRTGVYLVFCNDKTGEETHITKLLFIH